jgi:hypothetical protein
MDKQPTLLSSEGDAELKRLYADLAHASRRATAFLRTSGMTSAAFLRAAGKSRATERIGFMEHRMRSYSAVDLDELSLLAWRQGVGSIAMAFWPLKETTDISDQAAFELIKKTAARVGANLTADAVAADAEDLIKTDNNVDQVMALVNFQAKAVPILARSDPRLAEHRAARGARKIRGAKMKAGI